MRSSRGRGGRDRNPATVAGQVRGRVIELRRELVAEGSDAGPVTIAWHLDQEGLRVPARSTISRILSQAGLVLPERRKQA